MLQKDMEEKQLNFNQPFLTVRRHAPTATSVRTVKRRTQTSIPQLPSHRPELKSGPIRNPGAVPFIWEHSPGQPKEDPNPQIRNSDKPPVAPKLPPGRREVMNNSLDENVDASTKESKECSESGDEAYVDALDTLSRAESSFLNCSMSGLSDVDAKPSTDRRAREFMMDRFLPAAKAMASETTPQYVPKKPALLHEKPEKAVNQSKPSLRYGPSFADRYSYSQDNNNKDDAESDDEYDHRRNVPAICGLLPRFSLKGSLCLMSPVPAMSVRTRLHSSSAKKVERRPTPAGSYNVIENESRSDQAELKSVDKIQDDKVRNDSRHVASLSTSSNASLPFLEDKEVHFVADEKTGFKTFQELLDNRESLEESGSEDPIIEKTLYVDTMQKVEHPGLCSFSPKKRDANGVPSSGDEDQTSIVDSSLEVLKKLLPNDQDFNVIEQGSMEGLEKNFSKAVTVEKSLYQNHSGLLAPPPLPKSPSDSWLWRTLPSTRSSSRRSYLDSTTTNHEKQLKAVPKSDHKKWETIVKATNVKQNHLHYSEEMLTTIPET